MSEEKRPVVTGHRVVSGSGDSREGRVLAEVSEYPLTAIEEAVRSIRFGTVQIVIQDGRIVQIDKTEKIRLR